MRVLILGLGQYPKGSGVAAALYFARRGDQVTVTDLKTARELRGNVRQLTKYPNVKFVMGRHDVADVRSAELIVRNPRVRADSPEMGEAVRLGIPLASDLSLFLERCPARVIGITGTRGKSTTTAMIHAIMRASKKWRKVWLGGNISISPLTFLGRVRKKDLVVLEMSSFQLEGTGMQGVSPHVAVWTNLLRDHLNAYPGMAEYAEAKAQIFRHQKPKDIVFLPADASFSSYAAEAPGRVIRFGQKGSRASKLVASTPLRVLGKHNKINAEIAAVTALQLGIPSSTIKKVLSSFSGLPDRLEIVAKKKGITFINDTTATTPDATIAAIESVVPGAGGRVHVIFGGADKELFFDAVAHALKKSGWRVYLLPGTARPKIVQAFASIGLRAMRVKDLDDAFRRFRSQVRANDVVLLSPGCASFGLFLNEFDRGEKYKKLVARFVSR